LSADFIALINQQSPIINAYDHPVVPAIILAAGQSTRMGRPKPNLPLRGASGTETFLTRIVRMLMEAGVDDVVVVVGYEKDAVLGKFSESHLRARFVENPDYASGQLTSLVTGLNVVDRPGVVATLCTPVDVPFTSSATIRTVLQRYRETHAPIVRPSKDGQHGHPLLIDRTVFDALRHADVASGARTVVRKYASAAGDVEVDDAGAFLDIDTPEDYVEAVRIFDRGDRAGKGEGR
jgi:molybdenum cofactor cytidylyltransferase